MTLRVVIYGSKQGFCDGGGGTCVCMCVCTANTSHHQTHKAVSNASSHTTIYYILSSLSVGCAVHIGSVCHGVLASLHSMRMHTTLMAAHVVVVVVVVVLFWFQHGFDLFK